MLLLLVTEQLLHLGTTGTRAEQASSQRLPVMASLCLYLIYLETAGEVDGDSFPYPDNFLLGLEQVAQDELAVAIHGLEAVGVDAQVAALAAAVVGQGVVRVTVRVARAVLTRTAVHNEGRGGSDSPRHSEQMQAARLATLPRGTVM